MRRLRGFHLTFLPELSGGSSGSILKVRLFLQLRHTDPATFVYTPPSEIYYKNEHVSRKNFEHPKKEKNIQSIFRLFVRTSFFFPLLWRTCQYCRATFLPLFFFFCTRSGCSQWRTAFRIEILLPSRTIQDQCQQLALAPKYAELTMDMEATN